jgi:DNA-binding LacI/PurR family transcriptional regulator
MSEKRRTIAFLMDYVGGDYQSEVRFGIERAAGEHDVNLVIAFGETLALPGAGEAAQNSIYQLIGSETVDGIIVASATLCHHIGIEGMREFFRAYAPLPIVSIGMAIDGIPSLIVNNGLGIDLSVGHMIDVHGRRNIAMSASSLSARSPSTAAAPRYARSWIAGSRSTPWSPPTTRWPSG